METQFVFVETRDFLEIRDFLESLKKYGKMTMTNRKNNVKPVINWKTQRRCFWCGEFVETWVDVTRGPVTVHACNKKHANQIKDFYRRLAEKIKVKECHQ